MYSVLTFNLDNLKIESKKYDLVSRLGQMKLLLENLMPYIYKENVNETIEIDIVIPKRKAKSPLILSSP